jgi:hypothetical protein
MSSLERNHHSCRSTPFGPRANIGQVEAPGTEAKEATEVACVATVKVDDLVIDIADDPDFDPLQEKRHRIPKTWHHQTKPENINRVCGLTKRDPFVITKKQCANILICSWTGKKLANGNCWRGPNKRNHGLELVDGKTHCFVCNDGKAKSCTGMPAHLGSAIHQFKLPSFRATNTSKQAQIFRCASTAR